MNKKSSKVGVQTVKRLLLANKSGCGSVCVPVQSCDAQFFVKIEPLIRGSTFDVEMLSGKFIQKQVYLSLNLQEVFVGSEVLLIEKLLRPELLSETLDLIREYKAGNHDS